MSEKRSQAEIACESNTDRISELEEHWARQQEEIDYCLRKLDGKPCCEEIGKYGKHSHAPNRQTEKKDWISDMADGKQQEKEWRKREASPEPSIFERALDMDDEVKWWMKQTKKELISEFAEDWDFLYSKIYNYLRKYRNKELKDLDCIINMIYFYHISRKKKWEEKLK